MKKTLALAGVCALAVLAVPVVAADPGHTTPKQPVTKTASPKPSKSVKTPKPRGPREGSDIDGDKDDQTPTATPTSTPPITCPECVAPTTTPTQKPVISPTVTPTSTPPPTEVCTWHCSTPVPTSTPPSETVPYIDTVTP